MDGSAADHSDSDSGESWTLLEHTPTYAQDAPDFADVPSTNERDAAETNNEKDEDTDGISIISDSDPETSSPSELSYDKCLEESRPTEKHTPQYISVTPLPSNNNNHHESIRSDDDFLEDNSGKHKTYVHRRNKRLSTVLNIIMLGSVITAAGVAIGHMWGARNECPIQTTPSVNKILSNLYKLQEENAYLRSKLKELTLASNMQLQRKSISEKLPVKLHKCKKVYEVSLNNRNTDRITKCVDYDHNNSEHELETHMIPPDYEKDFLNNIDKLKNVYQQNKSWLDEEIARRMKHEVQSIKHLEGNSKTTNLKTVHEETTEPKDENTKQQADKTETLESIEKLELLTNMEATNMKSSSEKIISYADSLKSDHQVKIIQKRDASELSERRRKGHKKGNNAKNDVNPERSFSDFELKKDDRYVGPIMKQERKKHDRQKLHKKQKRKNKYEQWEMQGGYMKDYDEFSVTSQENENMLNKADNNLESCGFECNKYVDNFSKTGDNSKSKALENEPKVIADNNSANVDKENEKKYAENNWHEKRAAFRTEARKQFEQELFGGSPNNARWYFRRMQRREQCRTKGDNATRKKLSKRNMNYKMKH